MDNQWRHLLDQINAIKDPMRSFRDSLENSTSWLRNRSAIESLDLGESYALRSALDSLERDRLVAAFANSYRPDVVARMSEMLAEFQAVKYSQYQVSSKMFNDLVDQQKFLGKNTFSDLSLAPLRDAYTRLSELQENVAAQYAGVRSRLDEQLSPLLSAQAQWARTASVPSSLDQMLQFSAGASALINQIVDFRSFLGSLPAEEEDDEEAEQAIALANEKLTTAFAEKAPALTISKIKELLDAIQAGTIWLAPKARVVLITILLGVISNFVYDTAKHYALTKESETPRVVKEVKREVRRIQKEGAPFPLDLRVVMVGELVVRRGPGQSTPAVGRLYAADLVWLVKTRNRSWSLVEFEDGEGEVVLRGWVFSRHIKPLRGGGRNLRYQAGSRRFPPGAGAFDSGYTDTAERSEELLGELGFGEDRP